MEGSFQYIFSINYCLYVPSSMTTLLGDTAADNSKPSLSNDSRSSFNKLENPSLSLFGPRLQSTCSEVIAQ